MRRKITLDIEAEAAQVAAEAAAIAAAEVAAEAQRIADAEAAVAAKAAKEQREQRRQAKVEEDFARLMEELRNALKEKEQNEQMVRDPGKPWSDPDAERKYKAKREDFKCFVESRFEVSDDVVKAMTDAVLHIDSSKKYREALSDALKLGTLQLRDDELDTTDCSRVAPPCCCCEPSLNDLGISFDGVSINDVPLRAKTLTPDKLSEICDNLQMTEQELADALANPLPVMGNYTLAGVSESKVIPAGTALGLNSADELVPLHRSTRLCPHCDYETEHTEMVDPQSIHAVVCSVCNHVNHEN